MMPVYESPKTETGTNEGSLTPARFMLTLGRDLCKSEIAKDVEHGNISRQIGIAFPSSALAAPVQTDVLSQVGRAYKRSMATQRPSCTSGSFGDFATRRTRVGGLLGCGCSSRQSTGNPKRPQVFKVVGRNKGKNRAPWGP